ncbi:uncharacterized protein LOC111616276, partial [Centruroides sculpturatus]|uniref:uncharacterized protein LOC111616276 n=1 Tax=Centruroides sculpturatus TaxID=218467 RepID=UPI000C6ED641
MDSLGKPMGVFSGNVWLRGDYDQCLNIEVKDSKIRNYNKNLNKIHGKFCSLTIGCNSYRFNEVPKDIKTRKIFRMLEDILKPLPLSNLFETTSYKKAGFRVDICIPSSCDREDIENILQWAFRDLYTAEVNFCRVKDQKIFFSTTQTICIIAISLFVTWVIIGTIIETLLKFRIIKTFCNK